MTTDATQSKAIIQLEQDREDQRQRVETETLKLARLDQVIAMLKGDAVLVLDPAFMPKRTDYQHMGIVEAAKAWLTEVGQPQHTEDIAKAVLERGLKTSSERMTPNVYATLRKATGTFIREGEGFNGTWRLRTENDPPPTRKRK